MATVLALRSFSSSGARNRIHMWPRKCVSRVSDKFDFVSKFFSALSGIAWPPRVHPAWIDIAHFDYARTSLLMHLNDADADHLETFLPGSIYRFQYGGHTVKEIARPWLEACRYDVESDAARLWAICFELDRHIVLRNFPTKEALSRVSAGHVADEFLDVRFTSNGHSVVTAKKDIAGATVLCAAVQTDGSFGLSQLLVGSPERKGHRIVMRDHSMLRGHMMTAEALGNDLDGLRSWAVKECARYLQETGQRASNTTVTSSLSQSAFADKQPDILGDFAVTTRNIAAGEELTSAQGLTFHVARLLAGLVAGVGDAWVPPAGAARALGDVHKGLLSHERRAMGLSGACERASVKVEHRDIVAVAEAFRHNSSDLLL
eukprot:TRINITY_DN68720_c0_g1_i1.p1 TRINITY_DN68720_c0_g1~~TRINITY_DN68720_c0_g1_i1.p1  ORF type:complete len:375 (+),score=46.88 TRINITY_DN68720_c0_g1_i1:223-1347(+)